MRSITGLLQAEEHDGQHLAYLVVKLTADALTLGLLGGQSSPVLALRSASSLESMELKLRIELCHTLATADRQAVGTGVPKIDSAHHRLSRSKGLNTFRKSKALVTRMAVRPTPSTIASDRSTWAER